MEYNGWTNWETWHVALLIDNEYDIYQKKVELVKRKASITTFKNSLKKAETETRKLHRENAKNNPEGWGKFERIDWKQIYSRAMEEEY